MRRVGRWEGNKAALEWNLFMTSLSQTAGSSCSTAGVVTLHFNKERSQLFTLKTFCFDVQLTSVSAVKVEVRIW